MVFEAILGWASIRRGAFIRGERLIQSVHLRREGGVLDTRRLFESGRLLGHLQQSPHGIRTANSLGLFKRDINEFFTVLDSHTASM